MDLVHIRTSSFYTVKGNLGLQTPSILVQDRICLGLGIGVGNGAQALILIQSRCQKKSIFYSHTRNRD